jgi:DNA-binding transcriptional LysR family regulator
MIDADALDTFLVIHREGGFSRAARKLGRTQPAISQRIALLEQELGAPLFERGRGALKLSQAGTVLLPYAERAMAALGDAKQAVHALATDRSGPVALAAVGTLAGTSLTKTLRAFARAHPAVTLSLATATSPEVSDLVRRGEATIGLRYFADASPDLSCTALHGEALIVVAAPGHRFAGRKIDSLAKLKDEHWLEFPVTPGHRNAGVQNVLVHFRSRGIGDVAWSAIDSLTAQKRLVEAGFGLALLPESGVAEELAAGTLARIRIADLKAVNPVVAVTRRNGYLSAAARHLLALLKPD